MGAAAVQSPDTNVPEPDRLEGFPHPRERHRLIGHEAAEQAFIDAYRSGRLHHAWLISGPQGIGKATLAYRLARLLLKYPDRASAPDDVTADLDPQDTIFRQVAQGAHPDLKILRRSFDTRRKQLKTQLTVDEVRSVRRFAGHTAGRGGFRICLIDPLDDMNATAANALLKMLEEPPDKLVFLAISHRPGALLPTIVSRCRRLPLTPLSIDQVADILTELAPDAERTKLDRIAGLAQGQPARGLKYLDANGLAVHDDMIGLLSTLPMLDLEKLHQFADRIGNRRARAEFELFGEFLLGWLASLAQAAATGPPAGDELADRLVGQLGQSGSQGAWSELFSQINDSLHRANALNLDPKQIILDIFFRLEDTARKLA
jgi:DNA polymerase-3 subunit delta'